MIIVPSLPCHFALVHPCPTVSNCDIMNGCPLNPRFDTIGKVNFQAWKFHSVACAIGFLV
jgi:hypothetical protein